MAREKSAKRLGARRYVRGRSQVCPRRSRGERGAALVVVLIILAALLGAGAVAVRLQFADTKSTGLVATKTRALYCAEAGLRAAQAFVPTKYNEWNDVLDGTPFPDWYPIRGDIDGDGEDDYEVTLQDNADETGSLSNDPTQDNDLAVFLVSDCTKYKNAPRRLMSLVSFQPASGACSATQKGAGCQGTSNFNQ